MLSGRLLVKIVITISFLYATAQIAVARENLYYGKKVQSETVKGENKVVRPCLAPRTGGLMEKYLERDKPWSLPKQALAADFLDTVKVLVLRFNFQTESPDDPNTTGLGRMNLTPFDEAALLESVGHTVDPPPHNADYFSAHLRALANYYEVVSEGKITLSWDVYPPQLDSAYQLPEQMNYYGKCDFADVVGGLENYFRDGIRVADTTTPEINFSQYESIFMFHAGSDRQNDIGFPETCNDLFTGFIKYANEDTVFVDNGSVFITNALMMPEQASQDNRATALNAVLAHEFGHQLGLVDLYSTATFISQLGDFALMDNNGFGTGIDFGFVVGRTFGAIPLFPTAWSRAHLGFVDVVDFRQGSDIQLVAAEVVSSGIKVARIPISDKEYYLLENRNVEVDGYVTGVQADSLTGVFMGPAYCIVCDTNQNGNITDITLSPEYDALMPGSGLLIYHIDERVAGLDYNFDGESNFDDNQLQWARDLNGTSVDRFISLVEGDGFVNFGGFYRSGFGRAEDMYRDDRNTAFTPNTNPQTIDNTGNNTRIAIDNITRVLDTTLIKPKLMDSVIQFDVTTEDLVQGFPVRAGAPRFHISPIADDLNGDGVPELIYVSGDLLSVVTTDGQDFLEQIDPCGCPPYQDSSFASIHPGRLNTIPLFIKLPADAYTMPVTGRFSDDADPNKLVAIGEQGRIDIFRVADINDDGQADPANSFSTGILGNPIALTFGDTLFALTDSGYVLRKTLLNSAYDTLMQFANDEYQGICRVDNVLAVLAGDSIETMAYFVDGNIIDSIALGEHYTLGPIYVDLDLDGSKELVAATLDGKIILVSINSILETNNISIKDQKDLGFTFMVNPIASDVDLDGYPDIVIGGTNSIYAFNYELTLKTSFPIEINKKFPNDHPINALIAADIETGGKPELIVPTEIGNLYSFGDKLTQDFPLSGGEQVIGSPVFLNDDTGGKLGYIGADGWFYLWHVDTDSVTNFWPMAGNNPSGNLNFESTKLPSAKTYADNLPENSFYNYPNPVINGTTTIRYFLGENASSVELAIFDLSGQEIERFNGPTTGLVDNEVLWNCSDITSGIYRCVISVEFPSGTERSFTDISIIK